MEKYRELLKLARDSIGSKLDGSDLVVLDEIKKKFSEDGACFVTLTLNGDLRGCIGSLEAHQLLYLDIIDNAIGSAFRDPRFNPLTEEELGMIKIEVSVLTKPEKLGKGSLVFDKIDKNMGIILKKGLCSSTFLPQVWEQISSKDEFLKHLSMKAGLDADSWKDAELWFYRVEKVCEE
ncbi:AmmeMemoRadiSam system protein A [Candidatus Pacearchaeota archaeon]|nr:AmmeMemoRadiSam system protein A [Candidatus Pacearchaeota archaeon]